MVQPIHATAMRRLGSQEQFSPNRQATLAPFIACPAAKQRQSRHADSF
jgi:hypothetical protein